VLVSLRSEAAPSSRSDSTKTRAVSVSIVDIAITGFEHVYKQYSDNCQCKRYVGINTDIPMCCVYDNGSGQNVMTMGW